MCYKYEIHNMNKIFTIWRNALQYNETEIKELRKYENDVTVC